MGSCLTCPCGAASCSGAPGLRGTRCRWRALYGPSPFPCPKPPPWRAACLGPPPEALKPGSVPSCGEAAFSLSRDSSVEETVDGDGESGQGGRDFVQGQRRGLGVRSGGGFVGGVVGSRRGFHELVIVQAGPFVSFTLKTPSPSPPHPKIQLWNMTGID